MKMLLIITFNAYHNSISQQHASMSVTPVMWPKKLVLKICQMQTDAEARALLYTLVTQNALTRHTQQASPSTEWLQSNNPPADSNL